MNVCYKTSQREASFYFGPRPLQNDIINENIMNYWGFIMMVFFTLALLNTCLLYLIMCDNGLVIYGTPSLKSS